MGRMSCLWVPLRTGVPFGMGRLCPNLYLPVKTLPLLSFPLGKSEREGESVKIRSFFWGVSETKGFGEPSKRGGGVAASWVFCLANIQYDFRVTTEERPMNDWKILIGIVAVVWGFAGCSADEDSNSAEEPLVMSDSEVNSEESTEATDEESDSENREAGEEDSEAVVPNTDPAEEAEPEPEEGEEEPVEEEEETDEAGSTEDESESVEEESETEEEEESETEEEDEIVETEGEEGAEPGVDETDETETDETPDEGALEMGTADAMASMACISTRVPSPAC